MREISELDASRWRDQARDYRLLARLYDTAGETKSAARCRELAAVRDEQAKEVSK